MKGITKVFLLSMISSISAIETWEVLSGRGTVIFGLGKKEDYEKKVIFWKGYNSWSSAKCSESYANYIIEMVEDRLSNKSINSHSDEALLKSILHRAEAIKKWSCNIENDQDQIMKWTKE